MPAHPIIVAIVASGLVASVGCDANPAATPRGIDEPLRVLIPRDVEQLDPRHVADAWSLRTTRLLFASLVAMDGDRLEPYPDLAETIDSIDSRRWRIRLRPGLRFSDGSTLDAADVVATYRSVIDPALGSRYAGTYRRIVRIAAEDDRTVLFELDGPHATFVTDLELPIVRAEDAARRIGTGTSPVIGAGPFVLVSRRPGRIELAANPRWHGGRPLVARVVLEAVRDDNTRALRLLADRGDLVVGALPPLLVPLFETRPGFRVRTAPGIGTTYLGFNLDAPVLSDVRVRRAIAHALDRHALVDAELAARGRPARGLLPPGHWAAIDDLPVPEYDPAAARALLQRTGALHAELTLRCASDRTRVSTARAIAAMLARVGLRIRVRPSDGATLIAEMDRGRFEIALLSLPEMYEPHLLSWFFGSDRIPAPGRAGANRWRLRDPVIDESLERGRIGLERDERRAAYAIVQRRLVEQLPVVPLWHEDVVLVAREPHAHLMPPRDGRLSFLARRGADPPPEVP
ncbi:MAG: ABC transporter substrate-binding protein [Myxococcota bacterium]|nr:ABC transporter substrate-binding protein [Myxococcota bacterium]MDW8361403.1 ABC transporter substrate-binding protein [Myxococcales bacterium]